MNIFTLNDSYKLELVSKDLNFFKEEVFNKYYLLKIDGNCYLKYQKVYINGELIQTINKIDKITSVKDIDSTKIEVENNIILESDLEGYFENGYKFRIPNILLIAKGDISDEESLYFREMVK